MDDRTDRELIESFRNGEDGAFNLLVLRHQERVYRTARRILGSHEDADDVVQEAFLRVFRKAHTFRGDAEFSTWLYRIVMNLALNLWRRNALRRVLDLDLLLDARAADPDDPEKILLRKESRTAFDRAVETLPPKQKAVFVLRYHEGMKFEAIATAIGRSVGGVKSNYFHALRKISRALEGHP